MNFKTIATASAALLFVAGAAVAQTSSGKSSGTSANDSGSGTHFDFAASEKEQALYEHNKDVLAPFFTDKSMKALKPEKEVKSEYAAMDAANKDKVKAACEDTYMDRGKYRTETTTLCDAIK